MKRAIICLVSLLFLFINLSFVCGQNISVEYNSEVYVGENFNIIIGLQNFDEDVYDVKIDILGEDNRIAKIWDGSSWKSTYYYVNEIIQNDEEREFLLNVESYVGQAIINIRIRDSSGNYESFEGYIIDIIERDISPEDPNEDPYEGETPNLDEDEEENNVEQARNKSTYFIPWKKNKPLNITYQTIELKKTEPKDIKTINENTKISKSDYTVYALVLFCIILGLLFMLRRKDKNEFD